MNRKRLSPIFLILAMVFLIIGFSTDQEAFTYIAIAFALIALITNSKLLRRKR